MEFELNVVPITALVAVTIFLIKELIEAVRRYRADKRKLSALRALLAAECERNHFSLGRLKEKSSDIRQALKDDGRVWIEHARTGRDRIHIDGHGSVPVPKYHTSVCEKYLFEAASLDARMFELMEIVSVKMEEFKHLLSGLIEHVVDDPAWLEGWTHYAEGEIPEIQAAVSDLYRYCTGKPLSKGRVR